MRVLRLLIAASAFALTTASTASFAQTDTTLDDLIAAQRLTIATRLLPDDNIMVGQKLALEITIATDRWFKGGTRIRLPEVSGLVFLQTEQFASNASEQRQGQSWVLQRWSIDVYPRQEGSFAGPKHRPRDICGRRRCLRPLPVQRRQTAWPSLPRFRPGSQQTINGLRHQHLVLVSASTVM